MAAAEMGRRATGSVQRLGEGRYRARITEDGRRRSLGVYETPERAQEVIDAYVEQAAVARGTSLLGYGRRWLERREVDGLTSYPAKDRSRWRHVEQAPFAGWPLTRVRRQDVARWIRALHRDSGMSRQSVQHVLHLLRVCLREAADDGVIGSNPAEGVRVPRSRGQRSRWTWMTLDEIAAVERLAWAGDPGALAAVVAIYTGLRASEQRALRWEHVHLDDERPRIEVLGSKSDSAAREVPLLPAAYRAFEILRTRNGVRRVAGYVWARPDGGPRNASYDWGWADHPDRNLRQPRPGTRTRAGIRREVRWHDLRHTCASHLVQGSWGLALSLYEIMHWLGHSEIGVTQRYAHLAPEGLHGRARAMREHLSTRPGSREESDT